MRTTMLWLAAAVLPLPLAMPPALAAASGERSVARALAAPTRVSAADAVGDVTTEEPGDDFVRSLDFRRFTASADPARRRLTVRVLFDDLRRLTDGTSMYKQTVYVYNQSARVEQMFALERSPWAQGTTAQAVLGDSARPCAGARWKVDVRAETITAVVPVACLDNEGRKAIKIGLTVVGQRTFADGDRPLGADFSNATQLVRIR
jgi:hypothetical protein